MDQLNPAAASLCMITRTKWLLRRWSRFGSTDQGHWKKTVDMNWVMTHLTTPQYDLDLTLFCFLPSWFQECFVCLCQLCVCLEASASHQVATYIFGTCRIFQTKWLVLRSFLFGWFMCRFIGVGSLTPNLPNWAPKLITDQRTGVQAHRQSSTSNLAGMFQGQQEAKVQKIYLS